MAKVESLRGEGDRLRRENEALQENLREQREAKIAIDQEFIAYRTRETERQIFYEEKLKFIESARVELENSFKVVAAEISEKALEKLRSNGKEDMAKEKESIAAVINPIRETIARLDQRIIFSDRKHGEDAAKFNENLRQIFQLQQSLDQATKKLNAALRHSNTKGKWGELQLRRLVEMAGLQSHVDFDEQVAISPDGGAMPLRADMVIHLPHGRHLIVDAKAVLDAYMQASESDSSGEKEALLRQHAQNVYNRIQELGRKNYWKFLPSAFDHVVLFLPGDHLYAAAVQYRPDLLSEALDHRILLSSPMSLLVLLKTIACNWAQSSTTREAEEIVALGKTLLERIEVLFRKMSDLGVHLRQTLDSYNGTVASIDSRLWPTLRRFSLLQSIGENFGKIPQSIDETTRQLHCVGEQTSLK
jgi:DNA recombination protein RmuC